MPRHIVALAVLVLPLVVLPACDRKPGLRPPASRAVELAAPPVTNLTGECVGTHVPGWDYFPDKVTFEHSVQLQVSYHGHYKLLTFTPSVDTREVLRYALVQCGTPAPPDVPATHIVHVPVQRFTTSHHSMLSSVTALGVVQRLVGVANRFTVTEPTVQDRIGRNQIYEVGAGAHSNVELTMAVAPDVHFTFYSAYPQSNLHPQLWAMGVKALPMADHLETTPLGRAEWLKYLSLFVNREAAAHEQFTALAARYQQLAALVREVPRRPVVMAGIRESGYIFDLPGARNHYARLIHDAGGQYFWDGHLSGSYVRAGYERVLDRSHRAAFWIGGPNGMASIDALVAEDSLTAYMPPVQERRVYALDRGGREAWTFPYVDQGLDKPDQTLRDLIGVLHPDRLAPAGPTFIRSLDVP